MTCDCQFSQFLQAFKEALCMPEFPCLQGGVARTYGAVPSLTRGTSVFASATAHTKGSWAEVVAATEFDAGWIQIEVGNLSAGSTANEWLVDIGIGAAGSEVVIIPDLYFPGPSVDDSASWYFPISIPRGSRIAARTQNVSGSSVRCNIVVHLISATFMSGPMGGQIVSTYGADQSASTGTNIDPGGTAHTDSAWVEFAAATDRAHNWLGIALRPGDLNLESTGKCQWMLDVAMGAAGSEQEILSDVFISASSVPDRPGFVYIGMPLLIPSGVRLSARARSETTTDGDRDINIVLYGA